jgi:hypothetical protein
MALPPGYTTIRSAMSIHTFETARSRSTVRISPLSILIRSICRLGVYQRIFSSRRLASLHNLPSSSSLTAFTLRLVFHLPRWMLRRRNHGLNSLRKPNHALRLYFLASSRGLLLALSQKLYSHSIMSQMRMLGTHLGDCIDRLHRLDRPRMGSMI